MLSRTIGALVCLAAMSISASSQTIAGLGIGDSSSMLQKPPGRPTAQSNNAGQEMQSFALPDGNQLSVTTDHERIVYIELDRLNHSKTTDTKFMALEFGQTSLSELRRKFRSNGFSYKRGPGFQVTKNGAVLANSYEIEHTNNVLTLVTLIPNSDSHAVVATPHSIGDHALLEAIILSDSNYLESIWGHEKIFDSSYKKIEIPAN